jgi:hypothetical protein
MDSRDSLYEPVEAFHVVISCDYQCNLYINVLLIVILVTYKDIQKVSALFPRYFYLCFGHYKCIISQHSPPASQYSLPIGPQAFEKYRN